MKYAWPLGIILLIWVATGLILSRFKR